MRRLKKILAAVTAAAALTLSFSLPVSAAEGGISIDGVPFEGTLAEAIAGAPAGAAIALSGGDYEATGITLEKDLTLTGAADGSTHLFVKDTGDDDFGFRIAGGADVTFENLSMEADTEIVGELDILALIYISTEGDDPSDVTVKNCTLKNTGNIRGYRHAISFEGKTYPGPDTRNFNLTVENSFLTADGYGIGSGLDNNHPIVSNSSLTVMNTEFNHEGEGSSSIYSIHLPRALKKVTVSDCTFHTVSTGGIKYIYSTDNEVRITDNDFTGCNQAQTTGAFAIMATTQTADPENQRSYSYATQLSGNKLSGQNTILAVKAPVEVVWFPDGQAKNNPSVNNYGDENTTDAGTRYGKSKWGGNKNFIVLTDFRLKDTALHFSSASEEAKETSYLYNGETSGVYSNFAPLDSYWTEENPRHCSVSLADFQEANAITRWYLKSGADLEPVEQSTVLAAEDAVAKVEIDQTTGKIRITPKAKGTTYLCGVVGGGEFRLENDAYLLDTDGLRVSTLKNGKTVVCTITVGEPEETVTEFYRVTVNYLEDGTDRVLADAFRSRRMQAGSRYDVSDEASQAIDGYVFVRLEGEPTGVLTRDRVINVYYREDEIIEDDDVPLTPPPAGPSEDIPDEDVPLVSPPQTGRRPAAELFVMAAGCAVVLIGWKKRK